MSQSRLNSRRIRESAVARRWRANLTTLVDQLADGWTILVEDAVSPFSPFDRSPAVPPARIRHSTLLGGAPTEASQPDALEWTLRERARESESLRAPADFAAQVLARLPSGPPPFEAPIDPYEQWREHVRLVGGTLSFSALLMFGATWVFAVVEPAQALAILATLVSAVILVAESLRVAWQTAAGAASDPALGLLAMSAPLVAFLLVANRYGRAQGSRLREA